MQQILQTLFWPQGAHYNCLRYLSQANHKPWPPMRTGAELRDRNAHERGVG